ncbi:MAG TPA: arginine N-succinyltransferase [Polyangiaceae bacterium]|jgi:arginine N-succinyltransferase
MIRCEIRGATRSDEEELCSLARHLNSVNLPNERGHISRLLDHSERSFNGELKDVRKRKYVFLLRELASSNGSEHPEQAVGTSMIIGQLGRRDAPYIYFDVVSEEKYHGALDRHFQHTVLHIGFSYQGPTEIGGLVVAPEHRGAVDRYGLLISYVRFLYIATHRELFRDEILAELLPPLQPDGTSHLWEALGRRFTGMSYAEADLLSSEDKSFIRDLFPSGSIYASLLSPEAQAVIGKVGAQTKGVEKMLRRIGFRYAERIDPFDGGPHFVAPVEEISLVSATRTLRISATLSDGGDGRALVARDLAGPPYFHAAPTQIRISGDEVQVEAEALTRLGVSVGESVFVLGLK